MAETSASVWAWLNNELTIKLPKKFRSKKVRVIVEEAENERSKNPLLKKASTDPLFNSDIEEIKNDFRYSDKLFVIK